MHVAVSLAMLLPPSGRLSAVQAQVIGSCTDPQTSPSSEPAGLSPLELARNLQAPLAADTLHAEFEHASFWDDNGPLLHNAWKEWEENHEADFEISDHDDDDDEFIEPSLSRAIGNAFRDPSEETESKVKSLWKNNSGDDGPLPKGVYATQLLTPSGISRIRDLLDMATSSGIPTRRPNGMNRHGVIVDSDVHGAVSIKSLVRLVEGEVINQVVRPVGRMLFPDRIGPGDDVEYFAFTIRYDGSDDHDENDSETDRDRDANKPKRDFELKEHRDASVVTLNINLNLPEEGFAGSEVFFREYPSEELNTMTFDDEHDPPPRNGKERGGTVRFSPGMAIIHLGAHRHGSLPISASTSKDGNGKRYNLVIWLFGKDGDVRISPYEKEEQMNISERWRGASKHTVESVSGFTN